MCNGMAARHVTTLGMIGLLVRSAGAGVAQTDLSMAAGVPAGNV